MAATGSLSKMGVHPMAAVDGFKNSTGGRAGVVSVDVAGDSGNGGNAIAGQRADEAEIKTVRSPATPLGG